MGQKATFCAAAKLALFDHLVGCREQGLRYGEPERVGSRQIDDEIKLGRLLDRKVARFRAAQDFVDIVGGTPEHARDVWSIGRQTSRVDVLALEKDRRQSLAVWPLSANR